MGYFQVPKNVRLKTDGSIGLVAYYVGHNMFAVMQNGMTMTRSRDELTFLKNSPKTWLWDGKDDD